MISYIKVAILSLLLATQVIAVQAQSSISLTPQERQTILKSIGVQKGPGQVPFEPSIGLEIPSSLELRELPRDITTLMPQVSALHYARVPNKVLLVNPSDRKVVEIIGE